MIKSSMNLWALDLIFLTIIYGVNSQCCLSYLHDGKGCLSCPEGMHLYRNNCIFDVKGCKLYSDGFTCSECQLGLILDSVKNLCNEIDFENLPKKRKIIKYHTEAQQIGVERDDYFKQLINLI